MSEHYTTAIGCSIHEVSEVDLVHQVNMEESKTVRDDLISSAGEEIEEKREEARTKKNPTESEKNRILSIEIQLDQEEKLKNYLIEKGFRFFKFTTDHKKRKLLFSEKYRETVVKLINEFDFLQDMPSQTLEEGVLDQERSSKNLKPNPRKLNRTVRHHYRFTVEEDKIIAEKRKLTGKSKGDFGREMLLHGQVKTIPSHANDLRLLGIMETLADQLGKDSGLLWKLVKKSEEKGMLSEGDVVALKQLITELKETKKEINKKVKDVWR